MTLHDGERRVLMIVACCLFVGGAVRVVSRVEPEWTPGLMVSSPPDTVETAFGTAAEAENLFVGGRLDVNRATADQLTMLPGIGPAIAARVVENRLRDGAFADIADLARVKGIGPKTVERLSSIAVAGDAP